MHPRNSAVLVLLGILTTILVGWVLTVSASILQPLVIALLLASMLQPVVRGAARYRIPPALTVFAVTALLFLGIARVGILVRANVTQFIDGGITTATKLDPFFERQVTDIDNLGGWDRVVNGLGERLRDSPLPEQLVEFILRAVANIDLEGLAEGLIGSGLGFTKGLFLVLLYMVFIFAEQAVFRRKILAIAGDRQEEAMDVLDTIGRGVQRYLGVKTVVSLATGSLCYAMLVSLQIPFAFLFGFLTFLLNYIPTFGSIIAGGFATATALAVEPTYHKALVVAGSYLAVNITLGSFIEPRILGRELNLSPLVIIVSVVVWAGLWGVIGTFLAVPLTAAAQIILETQENTRPIAVMLSSGPPKERGRRRWGRRAAGDDELDDDEAGAVPGDRDVDDSAA